VDQWVLDRTLEHEGITRYWDYYTPAGLGDNPPMLILLHGGTGSNKSNAGEHINSTWITRADQEKFVLVLPNGTDATTGLSGSDGDFNWNDCRVGAGGAETTADDVGFLSKVIDDMIARESVNPQRVYVAGQSNGGMMSYRMALELSDKVAAIGAVIANVPSPSDCTGTLSRGVSVLIMNGTADPLMPWDGGIAGQGGLVLSAEPSRDFWISAMNTGLTPSVSRDLPDLDTEDSSTVILETYLGGDDGAEVAFYTVTGGGHIMPSQEFTVSELAQVILGPHNRDIEGSKVIWDFLKRFSL
jgi:polyhydroxybutyrate depolymerase